MIHNEEILCKMKVIRREVKRFSGRFMPLSRRQRSQVNLIQVKNKPITVPKMRNNAAIIKSRDGAGERESEKIKMGREGK